MIDLVARMRKFALLCIKQADALPNRPGAKTIAHQLAKSGTSVAANYRAAKRARSRAEFCAKLQISLEEADETHFWLDILMESGYLPAASVKELAQEASELTAILVASLKTARQGK